MLDFVAAWYVKAAGYLNGSNTSLGAAAIAGCPLGAHEPSVPKSRPSATPHSPQVARDAEANGGQIPISDTNLFQVRSVTTNLGSNPQLPVHPLSVRCAFVSTNSITQGEQVGVLWSWLFAQGVHIHFAHRTFRWSNEASGKAAVHCVIIGFGLQDLPNKVIYEYDEINGDPHPVPAQQISPYLIDAAFVAIEKRSNPICPVPQMSKGNQPTDNGNLLLTDEEKEHLLTREPQAAPLVRRFMSAREFLHNEKRWCLWLVDANPKLLQSCPEVMRRIQAVKTFRLASSKALTREQAATPSVFSEIRQPKSDYLLIPRHSSEGRDYIPFGFFEPECVVADSCSSVPNATPFHFGVMSSAMHMAWMRATCGRIKSDFRYSNNLVYNNFPWPDLPRTSESNQAVALVNKAQSAI